MGFQKALVGAAILALLFASTAYADDPVPPMPSEPPAGVALPNGGTPPPPPPPGGTVILVPPRGATDTPIYPTDQPGGNNVDPYAPYTPSVQDFDSTTNAVRMRTGPCAPRMAPCMPVVPLPCDPCADPCDPCAKLCYEGYGGVSLQVYPGLGFGVEFGMWFCKSDCVNWAWEVNLNYQDLYDDFNGIETRNGGKWVGARAGVKASFLPKGNSHPTLRAGLGWYVETGEVGENLDIGEIPDSRGQTNYFGGYVGVGWEWDLFKGRVTTGPEVYAWTGYPEEGSTWAWTGTIAWHFLVNF